jgi:valyl-tRNA synthetase
MAADAAEAARDGRLEIIPQEQNATWFRWLENIRDWCISRQLWWGHRIPAYYVSVTGDGLSGSPGSSSERLDEWVVARTKEEALSLAQARHPGKTVTITQDEDVLDTWFSSGIFPFSVRGHCKSQAVRSPALTCAVHPRCSAGPTRRPTSRSSTPPGAPCSVEMARCCLLSCPPARSLLETGHDILFFWVARMVMMGMALTGKVPFKQARNSGCAP